jgi:hypothetical protein
MKILLALLITVTCCFSSMASHILGGYIAAKQQTGRQYQITVIVMSDPNIPSNTSTANIELNFGDGRKEIVERTTIATENGVQRNSYVVNHLFASDGLYVISYTDPNWAANIINLNGGFSEGTVLRLETMIRINSLIVNGQSAIPLALEQVKGMLNHPLHYNPTFVQADGEDISIELLSARNDLTNYALPNGASVNPYSGMLTFTANNPGLFLVIFRVHTFRNGVETSQTDAMQLVKIMDGTVSTPSVEVPDATFYDQGWYSRVVTENEQVSQSMVFTLDNNPFAVEVYSELTNKGATTTIVNTASNKKQGKLDWNVLPADERSTPYFITYRYRSTADNYIDDYNVALYDGAPLNTGLLEEAPWGYGKVYPNPVAEGKCTLVLPENLQMAALNIVDALGRNVYSTTISGQSILVETNHWPAGVYAYMVSTPTGKHISGNIVVRQ